MEELRVQGILVYVNLMLGYFEVVEVVVVFFVLKVIDNLYQDILFVFVLCLLIVGVDENELFLIWFENKKVLYYEVMKDYLVVGDWNDEFY